MPGYVPEKHCKYPTQIPIYSTVFHVVRELITSSCIVYDYIYCIFSIYTFLYSTHTFIHKVYIYIYIYMCVCVCVYIYIYIYIGF